MGTQCPIHGTVVRMSSGTRYRGRRDCCPTNSFRAITQAENLASCGTAMGTEGLGLIPSVQLPDAGWRSGFFHSRCQSVTFLTDSIVAMGWKRC